MKSDDVSKDIKLREVNNRDEEAGLLISRLKNEKIIIYCKDLVKDYAIGDFIVRAVDHISLEIREGEFVIVKGPSGAGKTTLLNLIGGLDSPNEGEIYNSMVKISAMREDALATFRLINSGFVFQNYNLISTLTAEENVMFPSKLAGVSFSNQRKRAVELLKMVGLIDRREHLPFQLSAGEQQRVAIARALVNDPPIILGDEITANLDLKTSDKIKSIFEQLKSEKKTVVIATHDTKLIDLADRIVLFEDGKIIKIE
ncbi:MAG: ABC transporter ATP-binding protein [Candidatus Lokiarchaeota archaeon]|nr:ABC transporter ATP-binding protein [Candidatus Lokiarchaeota archaeon]